METRKIKATRLIFDYNIYPRHQIVPYHVNELIEALSAGVVTPPPVIDKTTLRIVDGWHRITAHQKLYGKDTKITCILKTYQSEADIYLDAIALNAAHGRALTPHDKARCISRAEELNIDPQAIASALNTTLDRVTGIKQDRGASYKGAATTLKRTTAHLAGEDLTKEQFEYNRKAGGMNQTFYINQVIGMIESESVDWDNQSITQGLKKLYSLLEGALTAIA